MISISGGTSRSGSRRDSQPAIGRELLKAGVLQENDLRDERVEAVEALQELAELLLPPRRRRPP